jgi:pimeloyl-ACP methyl ester carboxylesterase
VHVLYLHGFASSPQSSKAQFFADRFADCRIGFSCPDLNQPDFSTLTVSRMLQQSETLISRLPAEHVVLMGSSLGGFVAVEVAARQANAPRHRRTGYLEVFHYALNRPAWLEFGFYEDSLRYRPAARRLRMPVLIFQGRHDESVSPALVERFAQSQPNTTLHVLEDGHQLRNHLDFMWAETARFLRIL